MSDRKSEWYERNEFESAGQFTDDLLRRTSASARFPPNLLTLLGGLLAVPMCLAFHGGWIIWGAVLFMISSTVDWIDGALARYQQRCNQAGWLDLHPERNEWFRLGPTELGKKIDPVFDKVRFYCALLPLGWQVLPLALIWASLGLAVLLTFFREVVRWRWGIKPSANAIGKIKVYLEIGVIACLVFRALDLPPELIVFLAATGLGAASLMTQCWSIRRQLKRNPPT